LEALGANGAGCAAGLPGSEEALAFVVSSDFFEFGSFAEAVGVAASLSFGLLSSAKVRFEIRKRADKNKIVARALNLMTPPYSIASNFS
jgi:hypothetical protein